MYVSHHLVRLKHNPTVLRLLGPGREHPLLHRRVVRPHDGAVIEGFPRSANTFATMAFEMANPVKIGNHFHNPAQFALAKRYGVPAMLVLRDPVDAGSSLLLQGPELTPREVLERYIAFHEPLIGLTNAFSVAPFEEVTTNFALSIRRMNDAFGTGFAEFDHTEQNVARVFKTIKAKRAVRLKAGVVRDNPLGATTPDKGGRKEPHRFDPFPRLRDEAFALYSALLPQEKEGSRGREDARSRPDNDAESTSPR